MRWRRISADPVRTTAKFETLTPFPALAQAIPSLDEKTFYAMEASLFPEPGEPDHPTNTTVRRPPKAVGLLITLLGLMTNGKAPPQRIRARTTVVIPMLRRPIHSQS